MNQETVNFLYSVFFLGKNAHLISGVGHVGFSTFLRAVSVSQLHVEQVEDKAIESGTQTVAEAPNSCNHPLDNTYREKSTFSSNKGQNTSKSIT